jgi:Arc/MetJ family transcription regulator
MEKIVDRTPSMCIKRNHYSHKGMPMRTNIVIDDELMKEALAVSGFKTKKETG